MKVAGAGEINFEPSSAPRDSLFMTTLTDDRARAAAAAPARYFYFHMALACMAVAFLGFAPTYWLPLAHRTFSASPIVHLHGLLFFTWTVFFAFQSWLAASGRVARHRAIGMAGVSLATTMVIFGFLVSVHVMKQSAAIGQTDAGLAFSIVPLSGIGFFAVVFSLAIANVRQAETHKRLMLLAGISLLDAAVARWFLTFLAPPGPPGPPPVAVTVIHDWRTRERVHPVYVYGGIALIAVKILNLPVSMTPAWHNLAGGILRLAQ
jgi:hypothetical protein